MRLFVAVPLPPEVRAAVTGATAPLRKGCPPVAWVGEENLHLTLKFLGEVDPGRLPAIGKALGEAVAPFATFTLHAGGAGAFPSLRAPRVLWVGFREPLELAKALQDNIESALFAAGFPREPKAFRPHVTVGRIRGAAAPGWGDTFARVLAGRDFGDVPVTSVQLYESRLTPAGAIYRIAGRHPLAGGAA